ncbi:MAG TPA: hypothetical protein VH352_12480, partial [Pseudonocardiaceae bacterium]|nr:hypothetical protein [Pseudonocardiaceae bacterium]
PNPVTYVANPLHATDPLGLMCGGTSGGPTAPATPGGTSTGPSLISTAGSTKNPPVSDNKFNKSHVIDDPALDHAANVSASNPGSKHASEALGEAGAVSYLKAHTGHNDIGLHEASVADPHNLPTTNGQRWSHAVAFKSSNVADVTYWDGSKLHVIEAKGGTSTFGTRQQAYFHENMNGQDLAAHLRHTTAPTATINSTTRHNDGTWKDFPSGSLLPTAVKTYYPTTLDQGTGSYLTDIGHAMSHSPIADGRNNIGNAILTHGSNVHYVGVSSSVDGMGNVDVHTM